MRLRPSAVLALVPLFLAACAGGASAPATPDASVPLPSTPASSASPVASPRSSEPAADGAIVTLRVADAEEYRILLTDPADIAIAERLLAGEEAPRIPNGMIVRDGDGGVNTGYSWHIDPATLEFAEVTTEICDGRPSYVEDGTLTGEWFCPWSAEVVAIEPAG